MNARKENARREAIEAMQAEAKKQPKIETTEGWVDIVFDGPPAHEGPRLIEVENGQRESIYPWAWKLRDDDAWVIRIPVAINQPALEPTGIYGEMMQDLANHATPLGQAEARIRELEVEVGQLQAERDRYAKAAATGSKTHQQLINTQRFLEPLVEGGIRKRVIIRELKFQLKVLGEFRENLRSSWRKGPHPHVEADSAPMSGQPEGWSIPSHSLIDPEPERLFDPERPRRLREGRYEDTL